MFLEPLTPPFMSLVVIIVVVNFGYTFGNTLDAEMFPGAPPIQYSSLSGPAFLSNKTNTVRAVAGSTAIMPCDVRNIHNYTVSWVRGSDIRLLTSDNVTYTSDVRFTASHRSGGTQWLLKIHYVRMSDAGSYLCQVSTTPPITLPVNLTVYEAVARVLPGPEVHVQTGSRLEIICEVEGCPPPALLAWSRGSQPLVSPTSNTYDMSLDNDTILFDRLTLERPLATPADSGTYSCTSTCTKALNVTVHVLRGEELAAMQHHNSSLCILPLDVLLVSLIGFLILWWSQCLGFFSLLQQPLKEDVMTSKQRLSSCGLSAT